MILQRFLKWIFDLPVGWFVSYRRMGGAYETDYNEETVDV